MMLFDKTRQQVFFLYWLICSIFILLFLYSGSIYAADIKVQIDRTQIELNETFTLHFEASDDVDDDPDFSPLEKDFRILNKSTSSNISIINGQYQKNLRWSVSLMALREGDLTIPSISFGNDSSPQYQLHISPVQQSKQGTNADFMSELDINTNTAYPQSQIIVTQRLLSSRNISAYEFSKLKMSGVDVSIQPLGEIKQFQTRRSNKAYLVLEQRYAIFPQSAGKLLIEPSIASARIALNSRSGFDPFRSNTETLRRASAQKTITVKPVPASFKGNHWLPANEVQLVEEFPENTSFKVGEPVTRTLSLLVDGQTASQLPELKLPEIANLKQYPDQPVLNDNSSDTGITGVQQIKVALIPTVVGSYTLPEISISWWNTQTGTLEKAHIAARTFSVSAVSGNTASQPPAVTTPAPTEKPEIIQQTDTPVTSINTNSGNEDNDSIWKLIALVLFFIWLVTVAIFWFTRNKKIQPTTISPPQTPSLRKIHQQLNDACNRNDPQNCKDALLIWAQAILPDKATYSLGDLTCYVDTPLAGFIHELNSQLYRQQDSGWKCHNLLELCKANESILRDGDSPNGQSAKDGLPPLNP